MLLSSRLLRQPCSISNTCMLAKTAAASPPAERYVDYAELGLIHCSASGQKGDPAADREQLGHAYCTHRSLVQLSDMCQYVLIVEYAHACTYTQTCQACVPVAVSI